MRVCACVRPVLMFFVQDWGLHGAPPSATENVGGGHVTWKMHLCWKT